MAVAWLLSAMILATAAAFFVCRVAVSLGFPVTPESNRLGNVDGLRGFVALAVVFHHYVRWSNVILAHQAWEQPRTTFFANLGKGGVAIFFMITGAVFYPRIRAGIAKIEWRKLYISRAFRILPLSIVVTAIASAASAYLTAGRISGISFPDILSWVSGYDEVPLFGYRDSAILNAGVMWSLWYEWMFYICILPGMAIISTALRRLSAPSILGPLLLLFVSFAGRLLNVDHGVLGFLMLFSMGMLVVELRTGKTGQWLSSSGWKSAGILALLFTGMSLINRPYSPPLAFIYFLLLLSIAGGSSIFGLLSSKTARALGDVSFGIYMLHGFVLSALIPIFGNQLGHLSIVALPVVTAVVALASILSYLLLERPMMNIGKRLAAWKPKSDRSLQVEMAP